MVDPLADVGALKSQTPWFGVSQHWLRRLCTSNPFYAISAVLVLLGLRISCDPDGVIFPTWALLVGLAGYTLLLTVTACGLVRWLGVWDDVRTILLLVIMILTAIPAFFDDLLVRNPNLGMSCEIGGLAFAILVSESLLRGVRLRLPIGFRLPYYLLLSLFFLHPLALTPFLRNPSDPALLWLLLGFPAAAGLLTLTLIPAVRRGSLYVSENGSPWRYPLYPWSLFVILGIAIVARSYSICLSVNYSGASSRYEGIYATIFGPYFLVPIVLGLAFLVLEAGITTQKRAVQNFALWLPAGMVLMAGIGHGSNPSYQRLLGLFHHDLGAFPLFLTILLAIGFYVYAAMRGVARAIDGIMIMLLALAVISPGTIDFSTWDSPKPLPILMVGILQLALAFWKTSPRSALLANICVSAAALFGFVSQSLTFRMGLASHLLLFGFLIQIWVFEDRISPILKTLAAAMLAVFAITSILNYGPREIPQPILQLYPLVPILLAGGFGYLLNERKLFVVCSASLLFWCIVGSWQVYASTRRAIAGFDHISLGLLSFLVAALISIWKAGLLNGFSPGLRAILARKPEVERKGIEPSTSALRTLRSPN